MKAKLHNIFDVIVGIFFVLATLVCIACGVITVMLDGTPIWFIVFHCAMVTVQICICVYMIRIFTTNYKLRRYGK